MSALLVLPRCEEGDGLDTPACLLPPRPPPPPTFSSSLLASALRCCFRPAAFFEVSAEPSFSAIIADMATATTTAAPRKSAAANIDLRKRGMVATNPKHVARVEQRERSPPVYRKFVLWLRTSGGNDYAHVKTSLFQNKKEKDPAQQLPPTTTIATSSGSKRVTGRGGGPIMQPNHPHDTTRP